jgi:iron complex outermembrane receptor protein
MMKKPSPLAFAALLVFAPIHAFSQGGIERQGSSPPTESGSKPENAGDAVQVLSPVFVTASQPEDDAAGASRLGQHDLAPRRAATSDSASLLKDIPGVSLYGAGGISSLPVIHGIADDRLRTQVDGMDLMTACPNHMNPALSFIDPTKVASVEVFAGITPVSIGGDSIGGTIQVKSAPPRFARAGDGILVEGQAGRFSRSNGHASGDHYGFTLAGEFLNLSYTESNSKSDNYWAGGNFKLPGGWQTTGVRGDAVPPNEVTTSEYRGSRNQDLGLALKAGGHLLELNVSEQRLAYEGFPNQRMDMISSVPAPADPTAYILDKGKPANVNRLSNLHYTGQFQWGELEARLFHQNLRHHMDMIQDRLEGMYMPMDTVATTDGGMLTASIPLSAADLLRVGGDFQKYRLNDWWPPIGSGGSMCCNDFWNIWDGKRDRVGIFAEWEARWNPAWLTLLGVRLGTVESDAGLVQGYNSNGMYSLNAARFNAKDHARKDRHQDLTALARYTPDATQTYEAGEARKTRSPNLYERYPWSFESMSSAMNNFVGDGNAYIGNPDLKPEIAHTLSTSADWHDATKEVWNLKLTGYMTRVHDFIDAKRCTRAMSNQCTATNSTTTNEYVKLVYENQAARLYGMDISGQRLLGRIDGIGSFTTTGMLSYVRGENLTTSDNLYHIMPLNAKLGLVHRLGAWINTLEVQKVEAKTHVSQVRNEVQTPGYTLVNFNTSYEWKHARLDVGVENAFNKFYLLPLGGAYLGQGDSMSLNGIPWGMSVPGKGRSLNAAVSLYF